MSIAAAVALGFAAGPAAAQVTNAVPAPPAAAPVADAPPAADPAPPPPVHVAPVPEPGTVLMVAGPAAVGWVVYWRRRWRAEPKAE